MAEAGDLRERTRRAVRAELAAAAMDLFASRGFDATTVDEIAAAVGLSKRSFFRYFTSKEDVVLGNLEETGRALAERVGARPVGEPAWPALRAGFDLIVAHHDGDPERTLTLLRMLHDTPSLRARHLEKQSRWQAVLAPHLVGRPAADGGVVDEIAARAVAAAALACLDAAEDAWIGAEGRAPVAGLLDRVMTGVHPFS